MHILDHKGDKSRSAFTIAIASGGDITGGRYTRCYDQFKRYFIQAGPIASFQFAGSYIFREGRPARRRRRRKRRRRRRRAPPPWRCNFSGWPVRLDPRSLHLPQPHTGLDEKIIIPGERSVMANEIIPSFAVTEHAPLVTNE
jgi:hypothetical protein